ncbi:hypothetical protein BSKO_11397 [Bryopsis sp. KO-2023]|nr:hypothetical protein BSKO_11397 [Bryopsis sp. KO-2023]
MRTCVFTPLTRASRKLLTFHSAPRVTYRDVGRERQTQRPFRGAVFATQESAEAPVEETKQPSKATSYETRQNKALRISNAELCRSLMDRTSSGVLGNISNKKPTEGFPTVSYVEFLTDDKGRPLFGFSTMSPRTREILEDGRCSLLAMEDASMDNWDEKLAMTGTVKKLEGEEAEEAKAFYLTKHPDAFWLNFGDISLYRMDDLVSLYYTVNIRIGLGRARNVAVSDYLNASVDPVSKYSQPICKHMNEDHPDSVLAMVNHFSGIKVESAKMLRIDRLGCEFICSSANNPTIPCRLVYPRPAETRKEVREVVVEMTKEAAAAMKSQESEE